MEALQRLHNRGSVPTGGYEIEHSTVFESTLQDQTYYTQGGTAGTRTKHTWSAWIKRTKFGTRQQIWEGGTNDAVTTQLGVSFQTNDALEVRAGEYVNGSTAGTVWRLTNRLFRDPAAWYHIVVAFDTTDGTANDRIKIWINGVQETSFATLANPDQNLNLGLFRANAQSSLGVSANNAFFIDAYIAHPALVYNAQLDADSFGEFDDGSGIWVPIDLEDVTFGDYGYWMKADVATTGLTKNSAPNDNTWARWDVTILQTTDTPTNNFALLNIMHQYSGTASHNPTFLHGATRFTTGRAGYWQTGIANMGLTSGKWYFEAQPGTSNSHITTIGYGDEGGIHDWAQNIADTHGFPGETSTNSIGYLGSDTETTYGNVWTGTGTPSGAANSANYTISNIVGVAIDADNGYIYFAKDNTYINSGNPGSGASGTGGDLFEDTTYVRTGTVFPAVGGYYHTAVTVVNVNFGGHTSISISSAATDANGYGTFEYAPPSGYYAICTKNLAQYGG